MINETCICRTPESIFSQPNKEPCSYPHIEASEVPTWSPQSDALLLMSLTDAVVAVTIHIVARVSVVQVHIGRAVGVCSGTELW